MRIVVLDGKTLNPGDLSWDPLRSFGEVIVHERTIHEETVARCESAEVVLTNKAVIDAPAITHLPDLRYVGVTATGYNTVDVSACRERGIVVTNVPAYGTASVAQMTWALILELCHHVGLHSDRVREGKWNESKDFAFWEKPLIELEGLTLGVIGFGNIGQRVAKLAHSFGMRVLAHSRREVQDTNVQNADLDRLLQQSDFVSLHCPLTPETKGLINRVSISRMKKGSFLVNTSRGGLIVEADLAEALRSGYIAGAAVDVLSVEPPTEDNPLFAAPNCIITPHIAWATRAARQRLMDVVVSNLDAWLKGNATNVVG
ncbi:MAG TPA: D-2-hydroxyacid dehydrogenase [Fimbriimonadaceae bacterium]|nr:D-2-hydroxyacid dehydrogenase [Fimbriimonadaceae bacterium]